MKRGSEGGGGSDVCENGNGEGISRKRGKRKRKLHSEREGHRTAESWVGGRNEGRSHIGPGCQRGLKFVSLPPLLLTVTQKQRRGDAQPP